ncbi:uncharacterized protein [Drosophila takahashii]|uniref:uncharacterized protein n=1 Tax=Drosophila takahashii TaxID=29030 RepID=UPI00389946CA
MPRKSVKDVMIEWIINNAVLDIEMTEDASPRDQVDEEIDEIMETLSYDMSIIQSFRRGDFFRIKKSHDWQINILTTFSDERFKQMLRVSKDQFLMLLDLIRNDEIFQSTGTKMQYPTDLQLAIVLFRLGSSGNSASVRKISTVFGVGDGGTLALFTERVFTAFLRLLKKYIYWPKREEREVIVLNTFHELPYCIGYIDGSEIKLFEKPPKNHGVYYSRHRIYSVKMQAVCNHKLRIRDVVIGSPGSYHDSKIFKNLIGKHLKRHFSENQWIAGDSAYPLSENLITPYRSNSRQLEPNEQLNFNKRHSQYRVRIENCFGILKGKFCSLKELRLRLSNSSAQASLCDWVMVCCIIHNILLTDHDIPDQQGHLNEFQNGNESEIENTRNPAAAENKRNSLYHLMFE